MKGQLTFTMVGGWPTRKTYPNCRILRVLKRWCIVRVCKIRDGYWWDIKVRHAHPLESWDYGTEIRHDYQNWRGDMFEQAAALKVADPAAFAAALEEATN